MIPVDPPYKDQEWLPQTREDCYKAGWAAARQVLTTQDGALRRLIEKWRENKTGGIAWDVGYEFGRGQCANQLEAALAPLSGPVDASGEPPKGYTVETWARFKALEAAAAVPSSPREFFEYSCPKCEGTGYATTEPFPTVAGKCPHCKGSGHLVGAVPSSPAQPTGLKHGYEDDGTGTACEICGEPDFKHPSTSPEIAAETCPRCGAMCPAGWCGACHQPIPTLPPSSPVLTFSELAKHCTDEGVSPDNRVGAQAMRSFKAGFAAAALKASSPVADVEVIVNGQPVTVAAGTVRAVIEEAIRRSGQIGAPVAQWELRTTEGDIIPHNLTDGTDYELTPGRRLWLNLGPPSSPVADSPTLDDVRIVLRQFEMRAYRADALPPGNHSPKPTLTEWREMAQWLYDTLRRAIHECEDHRQSLLRTLRNL